ncbi:MAG: DUF308 domain-containing protein [Lachnospiraceae bacterium]|jgi:uncharacterized membrane protein HdeD (DUF308 family)|nr:DUF308 domain-containing protein [Lachnospiraceae bacterium]
MKNIIKHGGSISSVVMLILGIVLLIFPYGSLDAAVKIVGIGLLVMSGIAMVTSFIEIEDAKKAAKPAEVYEDGQPVEDLSEDPLSKSGTGIFKFMISLFGVLLAIVFLKNTRVIISILPFIIGLIIFIAGVYDLILTIAFRSVAIKIGFPLVGSIISIIVGIVLITKPAFVASFIVQLIAAALIICAIVNIITDLSLRNRTK